MRKPRPQVAAAAADPRPAETKPGTPAWRRARAREIVFDHSLRAAGANFIPIPFLDSFAVAAVQLRMLGELSRLYGRRFDEHLGRNLLASCGAGFVHHVVTRHGVAGGWKPALRTIPIFGRAFSVLLWPVVFAAFTHVLGSACARHYEAGGQFDNFKADSLINTPFAPLAVDLINRP